MLLDDDGSELILPICDKHRHRGYARGRAVIGTPFVINRSPDGPLPERGELAPEGAGYLLRRNNTNAALETSIAHSV